MSSTMNKCGLCFAFRTAWIQQGAENIVQRFWSGDSTTIQFMFHCIPNLVAMEAICELTVMFKRPFEMTWALWHHVLSYWKQPWEDGHSAVIKGWSSQQQYSDRLSCFNDAKIKHHGITHTICSQQKFELLK